jgi:conjugal transfer pilus assembly protein TraB
MPISDQVSLATPDTEAKKKKLIAIGIIAFVILTVLIVAVTTKKKPNRVYKPTWTPAEAVDTTNMVLTKLQGRMDQLDKKNNEVEKRLELSEKHAKEQQKVIEGYEKKVSDLEENGGKSEASLETNILGKDAPAGSKFQQYVLPPLDDGSAIVKKVPPAPPGVTRINATKVVSKGNKKYDFNKLTATSAGGGSLILDGSNKDGEAFILTNSSTPFRRRLIKNPMAGMIPATASVPIVLITGLDAIASGAAKGNPEPVHFRIQGNAFLPGDAKYRLTGCHGQAVGYGDLSTTRAKLLATKIVCVDTATNSLLESVIEGFIADSDGTIGMRGVLRNREGQIAAKAFAAAFAEGAANILAASNLTTTTLGNVTSQSTSTSNALRSGIAGGTSKASDMLAERYIEQMEAIAPSIEITMGRKGTLHFTNGKKLEWKVYQGAYTEVITPEST